jgi:hypothetical protein
VLHKAGIQQNIEQPFTVIRCDTCRKLYLLWKKPDEKGDETSVGWSEDGCSKCGGKRHRSGPGTTPGFWHRLLINLNPLFQIKWYNHRNLWIKLFEKAIKLEEEQRQAREEMAELCERQ